MREVHVVLDAQHRQCPALQTECFRSKAMRSFHIILGCASDALTESVKLIVWVLAVPNRRKPYVSDLYDLCRS